MGYNFIFRFLRNMSNAIVPLVWLNETAKLDAETHDQLMQLVNGQRISRTVSSLFLGFGVLLLLVFCIGIVADKYKSRVGKEIHISVDFSRMRKTRICWRMSNCPYPKSRPLMVQLNHNFFFCNFCMHNFIWVFIYIVTM